MIRLCAKTCFKILQVRNSYFISNFKKRFTLYYSFLNLWFFWCLNHLGFSVPRTSSARSMTHGAHSSVQGACCLDIGFRHMFSALDCAAFGWRMRRVDAERETAY